MKRVLKMSLLLLTFIIVCTAAVFFRIKDQIFYVKGEYSPIPACLENYVPVPGGYSKINYAKGSLQDYIKSMNFSKKDVVDYKGNVKLPADSVVGTYDFEVGNENLMQCADCIIRIYAEYFFSSGQEDKIAFHLTNGTLMSYSNWKNGKRLLAFGNFAKMIPAVGKDDSFDCFSAYLKNVYRYAGTKSLQKECIRISLDELSVGDLVLKGGTPGHVMMAVDMAENSSGEKCWLFAEGFTPAMSFHILKNPAHENDPWYYQNELTGEIKTTSYTFEENSFYRYNSIK